MSARQSIIPIFVPHWGCPQNCVFCNQKRITGEKKQACAQDVYDALKGCSAPDAQVAFYGGSFTAIPVCQQNELLEAASGHPIRLSTRPDCINSEVLERLKNYGVEIIELGAQSMDGEVLECAGRGHTAEDVEKASVMIRESGFKLILQMMTGLPGDSDEKDIATAEKIISLSPDGVRIYPTVIVKDTELYDMWKRGEYTEHTVEDAVRVCSKIVPLFDKAGVPVIRLGLNPTDDLSGGDAAGGAYHPALGEMVRSRMKRNEIEEQIRELCNGSEVCFEVPKKLISQYVGQRKCNVRYFLENRGITVRFKGI